MDLTTIIENQIKKQGLFKKGDGFVIGVSGGIDSTALLYCLNELKKSWGFKIYVAHLNHGLRKEADMEENFVRLLSKKYNLPFYKKKVRLPKSNIEEAGRIARYDFFEEVKKLTKSKYIVTAHNLNDNAETILLNLTRGAGLSGLSGMKIKEKNLVRPFLNTTKDEILAFANLHRLKWREDPSNKSFKYARNRIRQRVLPELKKINGSATENLVRSASILREASTYLKEEAKKYYKKNIRKNNGITFLALDKIKVLDPYMQKEILKVLLGENDSLKNISQQNLGSLVEIIKKGGTKEISLPGGLIIRKEYDKLMIAKPIEIPVGENKIEISKNTEVIFSEYLITSRSTKNTGKSSKASVYVDVEKVGKLVVRSKKDGDRVIISKDKTKKIQDIFVDAKIPRTDRGSFPVIATEQDKVVWVPFLRQSEEFRATKGSKKILNLKVKKYEKKIS